MQRLEVSGAVRPIYGSLGVKRLTNFMNKILFYSKFISCLYMFQEVKIVLYSLWYHHTVGGRPVHRLREDFQPAHRTATYSCDDTRCCIIQF